MSDSTQKHTGQVKGELSGFDRVRFKGTRRSLCYGGGWTAPSTMPRDS